MESEGDWKAISSRRALRFRASSWRASTASSRSGCSAGALDALARTGVRRERYRNCQGARVLGDAAWSPRELAQQKRYDAIICLGAVIRGDTPHFDYVAGQAARASRRLPRETGVPVAFGVLTTNTVEQAIDRAGAKSGNKGFDAAMTAIEMANLLRA